MKYTSCIEKTHAETRAGWTLGVPILLYVVPQTISQGFWYPWYELNFFLEGTMKVKITLAVLGTVVVVGIMGTLFKFNPGKS